MIHRSNPPLTANNSFPFSYNTICQAKTESDHYPGALLALNAIVGYFRTFGAQKSLPPELNKDPDVLEVLYEVNDRIKRKSIAPEYIILSDMNDKI